MKVKFIIGPTFDQRKKEAQAYIQKRAIEIYKKQNTNHRKPSA